jgi:Ca-activated chloride channel family protein
MGGRIVAALLVFPIPLLLVPVTLHANGVCFPDASESDYLELVESEVNVEIENQVAIVTTTQMFRNSLGGPFTLTYAFPMYEDASATSLSWRIGSEWEEAEIRPGEPPSIPGLDEINAYLWSYLGPTPLFFRCPECVIAPGQTFRVRLTYAQLLPYRSGDVEFLYPNDYRLIRTGSINVQRFHLVLNSPRTIENIELLSHHADDITITEQHAEIHLEMGGTPADCDYRARYRLSLSELGLFGMSSSFAAEQLPDSLGTGFFTLVVEPDTSVVISKTFTLIFDRSGSMSGTKITDARDAASFIVEHLNPGDRFNIVDFATDVSALSDSHLPFTPETRSQALGYIKRLEAGGNTAMSAAFRVAVPQFSAADDTTANIIIFFTDGKPTSGTTQTGPLLELIHDLILSTGVRISLFTFGIGRDVNRPLLTRMADTNNGVARFLVDGELEQVITGFYMLIRNPDLLAPSLTFSPDGVISELFPEPLPNLYQGRQLIVSGRYLEGGPAHVRLDGNAAGAPVIYEFDTELVDWTVPRYQFLPKVWAKLKIEHLMIEYYMFDEDSPEAQEIREQIIALSVGYGVLSPFTHFEDDPDDGDGTPIEGDEMPDGDVRIVTAGPYRLLGNLPNPFNPRTTIRFVVGLDLGRIVFVRIYDLAGRLVRQLTVSVTSAGAYSVEWDGTSSSGDRVHSGVYLYAVDFGDAVLVGKMLMVE